MEKNEITGINPQSPENSGETNSEAELRGVLYPPTSSGLFELQISVRSLLKFESHE